MPEVAVIGAGPSGLAAAKALLEQGIRPVVLDAAGAPGGMWQGPGRGAWSDFARTNISRHGCAFSDFPWPDDAEDFPVRRAVADYLRGYAERFDLLRHVRFGTSVRAVRPHGGQWRLDWGDAEGGVFDHVVIASGFFSTPMRPALLGLSEFRGIVSHSAECDGAATLRGRFAGRRVLVVGAAFSGTEIAGELAPRARVTVTLRHPMWFVPRQVAAVDGGPRYPLDLVIYNRRPDNPLQRDPYPFLRRIGGDPGLASPELAFDRDRELPMTIVISDDFLELVRTGALAVKRSETLRFDADGVTFADGTREDFDAVILCTGFMASLPFLDCATLEKIGFDGSDMLQPKLLHRDMFHPDLPGLSFIGQYRGPYFPVMELQARWLAGMLAGAWPMPDRETMLAGVAEQRALRLQVPRPQFPHGDFVALADGLAGEVGAYPELDGDDPLRVRILEGPAIPAHFRLCGPHADPTRARARAQVAGTPAPILDDPPPAARSGAGRRMLELLRGEWSVERAITPGGRFSGRAVFTPHAAGTLFYQEDGGLMLDDGTTLASRNSFFYALRDGDIEISFAEGPSRGVRFIDIALADEGGDLPLVSVDRHICRKDTYDATFRLESEGLFTMTYVVSGPAKFYVSRSEYRRISFEIVTKLT